MKKCKRCKNIKSHESFRAHKLTKDNLDSWCKDCYKTYRLENPEKIKNIAKKYRESNKETIRIRNKIWSQKNQAKLNAKEAARRASKLQATPLWANLKDIKEFYEKCPEGYEVDHIIPLKGKEICGLHTLENLQYLTIVENRKKGNKYDVIG